MLCVTLDGAKLELDTVGRGLAEVFGDVCGMLVIVSYEGVHICMNETI